MLLLRFDLDGRRFALRGRIVEEMLPLLPVEAAPLAPAKMAGLITWRNRPVPLFDLCSILLDRPSTETMLTRIAIISLGGEQLIGLRIENLIGTLKVDERELTEPPAEMQSTPWFGRVVGTGDDAIQLIEVERFSALLQSTPSTSAQT